MLKLEAIVAPGNSTCLESLVLYLVAVAVSCLRYWQTTRNTHTGRQRDRVAGLITRGKYAPKSLYIIHLGIARLGTQRRQRQRQRQWHHRPHTRTPPGSVQRGERTASLRACASAREETAPSSRSVLIGMRRLSLSLSPTGGLLREKRSNCQEKSVRGEYHSGASICVFVGMCVSVCALSRRACMVGTASRGGTRRPIYTGVGGSGGRARGRNGRNGHPGPPLLSHSAPMESEVPLRWSQQLTPRRDFGCVLLLLISATLQKTKASIEPAAAREA